MLKKILTIIGLVLIIAIIFIEGPEKIWNAATKADLALLVCAEIFLILLTLVKGVRLQQLAKTIKCLGFRQSLHIFCFGQLVNQGVTTAIGEVSKALMLKKLHGFSFSRSISIIFVERGCDFIFTLGFACLIIAQLKTDWALTALAIPLVFVLAIIAVAFLPVHLFAFFKKFKKLWHVYSNFRQGLRNLSLQLIAITLAISAVAWLFEGLGNQFLLSSLGAPLPLLTVLSITSLSLMVGFISGIPGGIGSREAALVLLYSLFGVGMPIALAQALIYRVLTAGSNFVLYAVAGWRGK